MHKAGFELRILASERHQTHALDNASTRIDQKTGNFKNAYRKTETYKRIITLYFLQFQDELQGT